MASTTSTTSSTAGPTLVDVFHRHDAAQASAPAIGIPRADKSPRLSYRRYHDLCLQLADTLDRTLDLARGDIVIIVLPNGLACTAAFLACAGLGWTAAPLNPAYNAEEVRFYIEDTGSRVVIVPAGSSQANAPAVQAATQLGCRVIEVAEGGDDVLADGTSKILAATSEPQPEQVWRAQPDDVALVLHTSGTTGRPKCVPLTHRNIRTTMDNIARTYKLTADDRSLVVMPLFHVHGLIASFLSTLISGGMCIVPAKFSASAFWSQISEFNATWYSAVPTIHTILLRTPVPDPLPKLRFIRSCSSALAPHTLEQLESAFKAPVLEAYAMTEAAHQMCSNPLPPAEHRPGTVGMPQGVELTIRDDNGRAVPAGEQGEVCVRGLNVTAGYRDNPEANRTGFFPADPAEPAPASGADSRWFRTGDRGRLDVDGYLTITGRIKELINRGGEKISPIEVDSVLLSCPGVRDAVCFAAPDDVYGEVVHCAVVSEHVADADAATQEELAAEAQRIQAYCRQKLSTFKVPSRLYIMNTIPKTATGKVQRRLVAAKVQSA
ncbi:hypothetical protein SYNPS1DRAFT_17153 [Syncephalis pseudoplumigaleata]|uniref:Peroxisomal-coenzyme A synthetase n=1 Tax=Syncephalis pseudoplumigaleata TaxID=1712513 RepID=A0A4P9YWS3_9FUNG|nr:hypothetical protein SYNPS1DRAFT_17153 [Syncephalis pseudoplumigaleata]|eukprot:RKP24486.1 hypothetical protein SYNPS1DRAFT_17153 [Syncephalis pseudoplumigaleata]